jgi:hypothetical protein
VIPILALVVVVVVVDGGRDDAVVARQLRLERRPESGVDVDRLCLRYDVHASPCFYHATSSSISSSSIVHQGVARGPFPIQRATRVVDGRGAKEEEARRFGRGLQGAASPQHDLVHNIWQASARHRHQLVLVRNPRVKVKVEVAGVGPFWAVWSGGGGGVLGPVSRLLVVVVVTGSSGRQLAPELPGRHLRPLWGVCKHTNHTNLINNGLKKCFIFYQIKTSIDIIVHGFAYKKLGFDYKKLEGTWIFSFLFRVFFSLYKSSYTKRFGRKQRGLAGQRGWGMGIC